MCNQTTFCCQSQLDRLVLEHFENKTDELIQQCGTSDIRLLRERMHLHERKLSKIMGTKNGKQALEKLRELKDVRLKAAHPANRVSHENCFQKRLSGEMRSEIGSNHQGVHAEIEAVLAAESAILRAKLYADLEVEKAKMRAEFEVEKAKMRAQMVTNVVSVLVKQ